MHNKLTVLFFCVMAAACATGPQLDPEFLVSLRTTGKATIASYRTVDKNAASTVMSPEKRAALLQDLVTRCIAEMEKVLKTGKGWTYVERSTLGLSGPGPLAQDGVIGGFDDAKLPEYYQQLKAKDGITAIVRATLIFAAKPGVFTKPVQLAVKWQLLTAEGHIEIEKVTAVTSDQAGGMLLDTLDPRYVDTFVALARDNAEKFVEFLSP